MTRSADLWLSPFITIRKFDEFAFSLLAGRHCRGNEDFAQQC
jgi:hypothetical protein